jgi:hypothetical protein
MYNKTQTCMNIYNENKRNYYFNDFVVHILNFIISESHLIRC